MARTAPLAHNPKDFMARKRDYISALDRRISDALLECDRHEALLKEVQARYQALKCAKEEIEKVGAGKTSSKKRKPTPAANDIPPNDPSATATLPKEVFR